MDDKKGTDFVIVEKPYVETRVERGSKIVPSGVLIQQPDFVEQSAKLKNFFSQNTGLMVRK